MLVDSTQLPGLPAAGRAVKDSAVQALLCHQRLAHVVRPEDWVPQGKPAAQAYSRVRVSSAPSSA